MSALEDQLLAQILAAELPIPQHEWRLHDHLGYRLDFAWPLQKLAVEVDGATWAAGRHNRGGGYEADRRKLNFAVLLGWKVLRFTRSMIESGEALLAIEAALVRCSAADAIMRRVGEIAHARSQGARLGWETKRAKEGHDST